MRAVLMEGDRRVAVHEVADPTPGPEDVVIAVGGCGLCGTDIHLLDGDLPYSPYPVVPGHEFYGRVVAAGAAVTDLRIGDWVAVDPNLPCARCEMCRSGRHNLCANYRALGVTQDGACAEFALVPQRSAYRLSEDYPLQLAPLVEPLACALHGFDLLPRLPGDTYLVYGAGTMGLLLAGLAAASPAGQVCVVDNNAARLELARDLGYQVAISAEALEGQRGWHTVIDATGSPSAIEDGLTRVRAGGVFQVFGVAPAEATVRFRPFDIYRREIRIIGSMAVLHSFSRAVDLLAAQPAKLARLVSHTYRLEDYEAAVQTFRSGTTTKVVISPGA
ncbi:MAG: alcohol dehydrogenase catalytic domain-containing protein [Mycobacteriales bacterium]